MKVSDLLVKCLEEEGVTHIFGVPGEENEDLLFSIQDSNIEFIPCRHEQGAAFIANVWGRLTGNAGVCLSTLGPGATNLLTGVADANLDKAPIVAITGQGSTDRLHHESHQLIDVVQLFEPITKWNDSIKGPLVVAEMVRKAFKIAEMEKPGATHLELSENIAAQETSKQPLKKETVLRPGPDSTAVEQSLALLRQANRPIIIAGNGAIRKRSSKVLTRLAEQFKIPVVATFMGKGALSDESEQSLLAMGLGFRDYVMETIGHADLVVTVGYDIAEYAPDSWNPNGRLPIIHIDFEAAEVYDEYIPKVEIIGDIANTLKRIHELLENEKLHFDTSWYRPVRQRIMDDIASYDLTEEEGFNVPGVLNILRSALKPDAIVISDVGSHKMWIARNYPTYCSNGCIISNGLASMGISLPGGIAASITHPEREVVCMMGDGGFLMNAQELETAHRIGARYMIIVFTDDDYGLISWKQKRSAGKTAYTQIGNPDFVAFSNSFGIKAHRPESLADLKKTISDYLAAKELCLIEIPIKTDVNRELIEKLEAYWK